MIDSAIALTKQGFSIFPVHSIQDGTCTCGANPCASPGKHPIAHLAPKGFKDATRDEEKIRSWWSAVPAANIGIRTGDGLLVIDIDPRNGGVKSLKTLPPFPPTLTVETGGGGAHLFFHADARGSWKKSLAKGIDIKADGGYVLGAGSNHISGGVYRVDTDLPIAEAPEWVLTRARKDGASESVVEVGHYDLGNVRQKLIEVRNRKSRRDNSEEKRKAETLTKILDGTALTLEERDNALWSACSMMAWNLPLDTPWEVILEIIRPSLMKTPVEPEGLNHWLKLAKEKFNRSQKGCRAKKEKDEEERSKNEAFKAEAIKHLDETGSLPEDFDWQALLIRSEKGNVLVCEANVDTMLEHAAEFKENLHWNEWTKTVETKGVLAKCKIFEQIQKDVTRIMQTKYDLQVRSGMVGKEIYATARDFPIDPVKDYLMGLKWDGVERLDTFFETYLGVDVSDTRTCKFVRGVSRKWFLSLVTRPLRPGSADVNSTLILEGPQGAMKSMFLREIVGGRFFLDTHLDLGNKEALHAIACSWLVELAELSSFRKTENERIKQFLTSPVDRFRLPYGRDFETFPRRCLFAGTTNEEEYLTDTTGNRRFWPIRVGKIDIEGVKTIRDLVLAEAVQLFLKGETCILPEELWDIARDQTVLREKNDTNTVMLLIEQWWYRKASAARPEIFSIVDCATGIGYNQNQLSHSVVQKISIALLKMGFIKTERQRIGGRRIAYYKAPANLLTAPQDTSTTTYSN